MSGVSAASNDQSRSFDTKKVNQHKSSTQQRDRSTSTDRLDLAKPIDSTAKKQKRDEQEKNQK
jgi:hypothetical protein